MMPRLLLFALLGLLALRAPLEMGVAAEPLSRERLSLDRGWLFHLGDIPFPAIQGHQNSYSNAKAGKAWGAAAPDYDDSTWRELDLPHDWAVEGPFDEKANLSQGYRPRGIAWYRRHFKIPAADKGRQLELQFDGVATHCTVWVNGMLAHRNWCGYTSFYIDITPFARYGDTPNTVVVRVDANAMEGWWYEGAGIYRHTWLVKRSPVYVVTDGVFAQPVQEDATGGRTSISWSIPVEVTLNNISKDAAPVVVESTLLDAQGNEAARATAAASVPPLTDTIVTASMSLTSPRLWTLEDPAMYQVRTVIRQDGRQVDSVTTTCGFRTIRFDADKGFFLNDKPVKLKGVCDHQDHAGVGVAMPEALWEFRLRRLKEMGVNAYRCAHNPPSSEFLHLCDRMGMLVMDENRNFNSTPEYLRQLEWMVRRDRNHPSVILWSVFNEEPMQGTENGYEMVRRMKAVVNRLDTTRPVTAAMNGGMFSPANVSKAVDVVGFNYQQDSYDRFHKENPTVPLTSSEDTSAFMTRGEYVTDNKRNIKDSYDTQRAGWGATHRDAWKAIATRPFVAGGFVWTGFDYRGEPTPFTWPSAGSFFGCMDLCGFPKAAYYLNQAMWIEDRPILQLIPHWNWPGSEGKPIKVMALTNVDTISLTLNGNPVGEEKPVARFDMISWDVPYQPGKLEAIGKKGGKEVARCTVETTGEPASLQLIPDRLGLAGDGLDAQPITVQALDARGRAVPTANLMVEFELAGKGAAIIGLGNGDPNSHEPEKGNKRSLYNGLAQVIVRTQPGAAGTVTLRAKAEGLAPAEVTLQIVAAPTPPFVEKAAAVLTLLNWRMSPVTTAAPDPNQALADNDMNSWSPVEPGKLQPYPNGSYALYRIRFQPG
ncbi:MAG: beta-galactosidase GalA, partial [Candidatus Methylacidiphilales bacterium]